MSDSLDALRYLGLDAQLRQAEDRAIAKTMRRVVIRMLQLESKLFTKVTITGTGGFKQITYMDPDSLISTSFTLHPIEVLGKFEVVELDE